MNTTHADQSEAALLGACMRDVDSIAVVLSETRPTDYRKPEHRCIYQLIADRHRRGLSVDGVGLPTAVAQSGHPDTFGGIGYVMALPDQIPSTAALPAYITDVLEAAGRRRLRQLAERMLESLAEGTDTKTIVGGLAMELHKVAAKGDRGPVSLGSVIVEVAEDACEPPASVRPMSTSIPCLDDAIGGGLRRTETVVIGARPGMGKTALAVGVAADAVCSAVLQDLSALAFSAEMSRKALTQRLLAYESGVPFGLIRTGNLTPEQKALLREAAQRVAKINPKFWIDDRSMPTLEQIEGVARRHQAAHGLDLIVLDYFQILGMPPGRVLDGMNAMSSGLMRMARDLNCCMIVLSQLNRDVTNRDGNVPTMADLKGCGKLEEDAHLILLPFRPAEVDKNADERDAMVFIGKNRSGPTGAVPLRWSPEFVRFHDPDSEADEFLGPR